MTLRETVKTQMGYKGKKEEEEFVSTLQDVNRGGAGAGFGGFTYYRDTCEFWKKRKGLILPALEELASDLGEDLLGMVAGFNCLQGCKLSPSEVGKVFYTGKGECADQVQNALAWFALEEVARAEDNG